MKDERVHFCKIEEFGRKCPYGTLYPDKWCDGCFWLFWKDGKRESNNYEYEQLKFEIFE